MKCIVVIALASAYINGFSQISSIWKGNAPGHEHKWEWPGNWSTDRVPDEFTDVIIPLDHTSGLNYPTISQVEVEINSLFIYPLAYIELKNGSIKIVDAGKSLFLNKQIIQNLKRKMRPGIEIKADEWTNTNKD